MWKRNRILTILLLVLFLLSLPVAATDGPDLKRTDCSITIDTIPSGSITLYRVGEISQEDDTWCFRPTEDFKSSGQALEKIDSPSLAKALWDYARENTEIKSEVYKIKMSKVTVNNLNPGLYLIGQTKDQASGKLAPVNPFLVSIPHWENGQWDYSIDASPKTGTDITPTPTPTPPNPPPRIPNTGQMNWPVPVLAISGLVFVMLGFCIRYSERKAKDEK